MTSFTRKLLRILWSREEPYRVAPCGTRMSVRSLLLSVIIAIGIFYYAVLVMEANMRSPVSKIRSSEEETFSGTDIQETVVADSEFLSDALTSDDREDYPWPSSTLWSGLNYTRLIAPRNFPDHSRFVYVVHSRVQSRALRDAVRETWAKDVRRSKDGALVFLLGSNKSLQETAQNEAERYDDILQYDVAESYANLTRKSIMMLKWAGETLSRDAILVKADDDVLVNVFNLERTLQALSGVTPKFIAGRMMKDTKPVRDPSAKWFVPKREYLDEHYPPYFAGCLYVITGNLINSMLRAIETKKLMGMEDVYITGLLSEKLQLSRVGLRGINSYENKTPCEMHDELARHYVSEERLIEDHHILKTTIRICRFWFITGSCWCESSIETILPESIGSSLRT